MKKIPSQSPNLKTLSKISQIYRVMLKIQLTILFSTYHFSSLSREKKKKNLSNYFWDSSKE